MEESKSESERLFERFSELLSLSEQRIDRTNVFIGKLANCTEKIASVYADSVKALQDQRDILQKQVMILSEANLKMVDQLANERERYDKMTAMFERLIATIPSAVQLKQ